MQVDRVEAEPCAPGGIRSGEAVRQVGAHKAIAFSTGIEDASRASWNSALWRQVVFAEA